MLAFVGVLILTPDSLLIRLIDADPWAFMFWRGVFNALGLALMMMIRFRTRLISKTLEIGVGGFLVSVVFAINAVGFVVAIAETTVANVLLIVSIAPLIAAVIGRFLMDDEIAPRTWAAIVIAIGGIVVIVEGGFGSGRLVGDIAALIKAIGLGVHFCLVRSYRPIDMTPAIALSGVVTALVGLVGASSLAFTPVQIGLSAIIGLLILPLSFGLLTLAPLYIPAAEVSLMLLLETVLAPIWVWLALGERPDNQTLIGGAIVMSALVGHGMLSLRARRRRTISARSPR